MQKIKNTQGFTLVELLVVIVIIGILATGAVSMFTGAQQKARDSVRITDIQAVKLGVEQYYGDKAEYPNADLGAGALEPLSTNGYIDKLPSDPKKGEENGSSVFVYVYGSSSDTTTSVQGQEFELSALFENAGNTDSKSKNDEGNDPVRWETGINIDEIETNIDTMGSISTSYNNHMSDASFDDVFIVDCNVASDNISGTECDPS